MSKYLEDNQGKVQSNPINETNTKYAHIPTLSEDGHNASRNELDYQYMYNHDEPVSNIDTDVFDSYRNKTEELRKRTESWYEALESCLVPAEIPGMAFQPYEYRDTEDDDGNSVTEKIKSLQYFFQDHAVMIGSDSKEFVFRTNKVKFIDDRHRRLIYDRQIHIMTSKEDEDNGVSFRDVLKRTFFETWKERSLSVVRNLNSNRYTLANLMSAILDANRESKDNEYMVVLVPNEETGELEEKKVESTADFKYPMQSGQDINTTIPSSVFNLYNIGWIHASMIFLNGLVIPWTKSVISVDNIDTFVIVTNLADTLSGYIDDDKEITMDYVHIPFKCIYMHNGESPSGTSAEQYLKNGLFENPVFCFDRRYGGMMPTIDSYKNPTVSGYIDRVICVDPNIKFGEFYLNQTNDKETYLPDIGVQFSQSFREFCNNDYRCKLKKFNFLGFEIDRDLNNEFGKTSMMKFKNGDYNVTWHPFNIMDIRFKRLYNQRRLFKVFYNTKVLYDQDNILRIKNLGPLADEYEKYRQDVTANIEVYIKEIYLLAKKDIGVYIANKGFTKGFKYHYVSPYECFLLYNAIQTLLGEDTVTFDDFRNINVINIPTHVKKTSSSNTDDSSTPSSGGSGTGGAGFDYTYPNYVYDDSDDDDDVVDTSTEKKEEDTLTPFEIDNDNYLGYMNGGFIIFDDDHNFFDTILKETDLYNEDGTIKDEIKEFWQSIIDMDADNTVITDLLVPIDDVRALETKLPISNNAFYAYSGDNRGKVLPYSRYYTDYDLQAEYDDLVYDYLKLRFEMSYLNNMEEGATPVDEYIYYFDHDNFSKSSYPVVSSYKDRYTANVLNTLAYNIFKSDPHQVLESIVKMNYMADYIIPMSLGTLRKEDCITYIELPPERMEIDSNYKYQYDPRYFYNFGYYKNGDMDYPIKLVSEWGLRRNLPEMFYWALDKDEYTLDSMHLLDEVFDFTYGFDKDYEANLKHGVDYIIGYDADKLEQSIKRSIVSMSRTGKQLKEYMTNHPATIYCTTDSYKQVNFVTEVTGGYIVPISDIRIHAYFDVNNRLYRLDYEDNTGMYENVTVIDAKYFGQERTTVTIDTSNKWVYNVDKGYYANYSYAQFNGDTKLVEFYNSSDTLVCTFPADVVHTYQRLEMSRWNIAQQDNYVMIFKNRELYDKYNTIEYTDISFSVELAISDIQDDDVFEFVFFLNANNAVIEKVCEEDEDLKLTVPSGYKSVSSKSIRVDKNGDKLDKGLYSDITSDYTFDKAVACNTSVLDAENVQLLVNVMPLDGDKWRPTNNKNTTYELEYGMYSYKATTDNETGVGRTFTHTLDEDKKLNGLHRVTKQGGGEYFLTFDGTVPEKTDSISDNGNSHINPGGSSSNIGLGLLCFGTNNINSIKFNGTVEDWSKVAKLNPWLNSAHNLNLQGGLECSDGKVLITDEEQQWS